MQGNLLDTVKEPADVVVANILAEVIMTFTDDAYTIVKPGGLFITSGIIEPKKDDVKASLVKAGFIIEEVMMMEDWVAIISRKSVN
jgi:ribosomal protein L11 methyltransferase